MRSPQSDDQPWHADLGSYQIDREPKGQEHAFISLCTNARDLPFALGAGFHQPQNPAHTSTPGSDCRREK
jgi:hypothetical protein